MIPVSISINNEVNEIMNSQRLNFVRDLWIMFFIPEDILYGIKKKKKNKIRVRRWEILDLED